MRSSEAVTAEELAAEMERLVARYREAEPASRRASKYGCQLVGWPLLALAFLTVFPVYAHALLVDAACIALLLGVALHVGAGVWRWANRMVAMRPLVRALRSCDRYERVELLPALERIASLPRSSLQPLALQRILALAPLLDSTDDPPGALPPALGGLLRALAPRLARVAHAECAVTLLRAAERHGGADALPTIRQWAEMDAPTEPLRLVRRQARLVLPTVAARAQRQSVGRALVRAADGPDIELLRPAGVSETDDALLLRAQEGRDG